MEDLNLTTEDENYAMGNQQKIRHCKRRFVDLKMCQQKPSKVKCREKEKKNKIK